VTAAQERVVAVIAAASASQADGIRDHTTRLIEHLEKLPGIRVASFLRTPGAWQTNIHGNGAHPLDGERPVAVVLQYNPFWHGHRGFAPGLALMILRLRRSMPGARLALFVHETYVKPTSFRWALMSGWQRFQLMVLQALVDVQFGTIEEWVRLLRRNWPFRPVHHVPVGSNLPDRRGARTEGRERIGATADTLVLAGWGIRHPGRRTAQVLTAARELGRRGHDVILLNLGAPADSPERTEVAGVRVLEPGYLEEEEMAMLLAASDLFLAPFADGVSTRRTSVMSALQHELAVVGTVGSLTDPTLAPTDAMVLVPVGDEAAFADAVVGLAEDPERRRALALAGRRLFEREFDWPVIAARVLALLEDRP
jgi:glycosyltransferase involved in cell wall biosynthesis